MILHFVRNLADFPFGSVEAHALLKNSIQKLFPSGRWLTSLKASDEKKLTDAFFFNEPFKALFIDIEHHLLIALGAVDHLHILFDGDYQTLKPQIQSLHQHHKFAFDSQFGFLTSHLETTGTGCKARFFREILYPNKPDNIETLPFGGGYIYQNKTAIGLLESTLIEQLKALEKTIDEHLITIKTPTPLLLQDLFNTY